MIDLYHWTTPNGHKIAMFLEETELGYTPTVMPSRLWPMGPQSRPLP
jgi:glutathione S-transferase